MRNFILNFFLIFITVSIATSCSKKIARDPPETVSEALNQLVGSAPYQYIDLDSIEVQEIALTDNDIIYNISQTGEIEEPIIGSLSDFIYVNDQFFIYDAANNAIFQTGRDGAVEGPITREGRGPGEHNFVNNLKVNRLYIYAADGNNGRINRYTHSMIPVEPLRGYIYGQMELNDELIAIRNRLSDGFAPKNAKQGLISILSIDNLRDTLATIMPRIVPPGYQPAVYNSTMFSINNKNQIIASYKPLPWLFLFDEDFNHTLTLILESSVFEKLDIPPMKFFRPKGNEGFGGSIPLLQFTLNNNEDLFISMPGEVTIVSSSSADLPFDPGYRINYFKLVHLTRLSDGTYKINGVYKFQKKDDAQHLFVMEMVLSEQENIFYGLNHEYLFEFKLPE